MINNHLIVTLGLKVNKCFSTQFFCHYLLVGRTRFADFKITLYDKIKSIANQNVLRAIHQSFVVPIPTVPWNIVLFSYNFLVCKTLLKTLHGGAKFMVKSPLKAPALPPAPHPPRSVDNKENNKCAGPFRLTSNPILWRLLMKFGFNWPSGFREHTHARTHTHTHTGFHYENTPIQIYRTFHLKGLAKLKLSDKKNSDIFHISAQNIDCQSMF